MGEDLSLLYLGTNRPHRVSFDAALARAASLTPDDLAAAGSTISLDETGSDAADALVHLRDRAIAAVSDVSDMWCNRRRDSVRLSIGTSEVLIVGGMSSGDSPSDAFDSMLVFLGCGLHQAAGFDL